MKKSSLYINTYEWIKYPMFIHSEVLHVTLAICLSLNLLLLIGTVVSPLKLHLFEKIFIWVIVTFLHQMGYYLLTQNYQFWETPMRLDLFWGLVITRMVSIPFLFLWLIDLSRRCFSSFAKGALLLLFISLLAGLDFLMDYAKIVRFVTWSLWSSYAEWLLISSISLLLLRGYYIILRREKFI